MVEEKINMTFGGDVHDAFFDAVITNDASGSIVNQEKIGQAEFVNSSTLPKKFNVVPQTIMCIIYYSGNYKNRGSLKTSSVCYYEKCFVIEERWSLPKG